MLWEKLRQGGALGDERWASSQTPVVTSEGAPEEDERRKDEGDSEDTGQRVGPCLSARRGGGWRGDSDPSALFLGDPELIPDVASSLPAQGNDTPCHCTNTARDTFVIPRYSHSLIVFVQHLPST